MSADHNMPPGPRGPGGAGLNTRFGNMNIGTQPFVPNVQAQPFVPMGGPMHTGYPYPMQGMLFKGADF